jgi:hypothetical protein
VASAWGQSWGSAWGAAWGPVVDSAPVITPYIGGGYMPRIKEKPERKPKPKDEDDAIFLLLM